MTSASTAAARTRIVILALAVALLAAACTPQTGETAAQQPDDQAGATYDRPDWIEEVFPAPGAEESGTAAVQVNHTVTDQSRLVRLRIDDVDVTASIVDTSPGLLSYDASQDLAPVDLGPGEHTATAELWRRTPGSGEGVEDFDPATHDKIDEFQWSFTIL